VNTIPDQDREAVIKRPKNPARVAVNIAALSAARVVGIERRHTRKANAISTGSITTPEYAVALLRARLAAEATSNVRHCLRWPA
jgi:hypothetical protein